MIFITDFHILLIQLIRIIKSIAKNYLNVIALLKVTL
jgi:hypothetical protein